MAVKNLMELKENPPERQSVRDYVYQLRGRNIDFLDVEGIINVAINIAVKEVFDEINKVTFDTLNIDQ